MRGSSSSCQPDLLLHEFISAIKTEIYQQTCSSWLLLMVIVCPPLTALILLVVWSSSPAAMGSVLDLGV
jgi:hypothetical protein